MTKPQQATLTDALADAIGASQQFLSAEDGGTCNFDQVAIPAGRNGNAIMDALRNLAVDCYETTWFGRKTIMADFSNGNGQGNRRTKVNEVACNKLAAAGIECSMYYQMD